MRYIYRSVWAAFKTMVHDMTRVWNIADGSCPGVPASHRLAIPAIQEGSDEYINIRSID